MPPEKKPKTILSIAGSDPSGGAGIQADLKVIHALGGYAVTAITALTVQNTQGVQSVHPVAADLVRQQIESLFADIEIHAIKVGMLGGENIVKMLAALLQQRCIPIVLDPVLVSSSGRSLLDRQALVCLREQLVPLCTLVTPNLDEVEALTGSRPVTRCDRERAGEAILHLGCPSVLIKGGHSPVDGENCDDCLITQDFRKVRRIRWFSSPRQATANTHGTGCTLASAIATFLATGLPLDDAIREAKCFLDQSLAEGIHFRLGCGVGPAFASTRPFKL